MCATHVPRGLFPVVHCRNVEKVLIIINYLRYKCDCFSVDELPNAIKVGNKSRSMYDMRCITIISHHKQTIKLMAERKEDIKREKLFSLFAQLERLREEFCQRERKKKKEFNLETQTSAEFMMANIWAQFPSTRFYNSSDVAAFLSVSNKQTYRQTRQASENFHQNLIKIFNKRPSPLGILINIYFKMKLCVYFFLLSFLAFSAYFIFLLHIIRIGIWYIAGVKRDDASDLSVDKRQSLNCRRD